VSEVSRIQEQLKRAMEGGAWHGPALLELLSETPVDLAPAKPLAHAHSIWEIVLHITAWNGAILQRVQGKEIELEPEQDWPQVKDFGESAWAATVKKLRQSYEALYAGLSKLADARLNERAPGSDHDVYSTLHGGIHHILYHAGQIAVLKKSER
jgi:uncharacterized damage-inducible protein DinB